MPKTDLSFNPALYTPVAERVTLFYQRFPTGRIVTQLRDRSEGVVTFLALVYRSTEETEPAATGWASEREGDGEVNAVACVENTETSAIGRALANLGFTASVERPSQEEMLKAARERARLAREALVRRVSEAPPIELWRRAEGSAAPSPERSPLLNDVLDLLAEAERAGLAIGRTAKLRERLERGSLSEAALARLEVALRRYLSRRDAPL